jgi:hypothetical protein
MVGCFIAETTSSFFSVKRLVSSRRTYRLSLGFGFLDFRYAISAAF